jgi:hypothetical protein
VSAARDHDLTASGSSDGAQYPNDADRLGAAFMAGFMASGEGWNGEYPFERATPGDPRWDSVRAARDRYLLSLEIEAEAELACGMEQGQ